MGRISLVSIVERDHPGYLHSLYRETINLKGSSLSYVELTEEMNTLSVRTSDQQPSLNLSKKYLGMVYGFEFILFPIQKYLKLKRFLRVYM